MHRIFATYLIDECWYSETLFDPLDHIEVGHARFYHHHVRTFLQIKRDFSQCFIAIGRIHLVTHLIALPKV